LPLLRHARRFKPGIHAFAPLQRGKTWMAGTSPAMTGVG
jgi:hypothetical protein